MALSGSFYTNVGSGYRLQLEWSATQDITSNTSSVTAKLYWMSLGSPYTVNSSASKDCTISIDGSSSSTSGAGMASLRGNQKKLIYQVTKNVPHNNDGTKSISFDGWFDAEVTLSGTHYSRIKLPTKIYTLNTIPRSSSLSSNPSWIAGEDLPLAISRSSTSFIHTIKLYVNDILIKALNNIETSTTITFSESEYRTIFTQLNQTGSKPSTILLETYQGSNLIGSKEYTGLCKAPSPSKVASGSSFNIGDTVLISLSSANHSFTHDLKLYVGESLIKTYSSVGLEAQWIPTQAEKEEMYATTPNANTVSTRMECITYYQGIQVQSLTSVVGTAIVTNSDPTFNDSFIYKDTNATTLAITENDQYIIQNHSTVLVEIPFLSKAIAINGSTMEYYVATLNGMSISRPYSSSNIVSFDFGSVQTNTSVTLSVKAVDSRGNSTIVTKAVSILEYSSPTLTFSARRSNDFESETILKAGGNLSLLSIGKVPKNRVKTLQYRFKETISPTWSDWVSLSASFVQNGSTYTNSDTPINTSSGLDNLKAWNIEVQVVDLLSSSLSSAIVPVGQPLLFIDSTKKSIGINQFPNAPSSLEVNGNLNVTGGITLGSTGIVQVKEDMLYFNEKPIASANIGTGYLWTGSLFMSPDQSITPTKTISSCPNGWILVWSEYSEEEVRNWDFVFHPIPKYIASNHSGAVSMFSIPVDSIVNVVKELEIYDDRIKGFTDKNATGDTTQATLRYVLEW
ncbi:DUF859 family phage minor structural protein [Thermoactinomyces sp. DSM 45892]|uniref:DUF859 family phage minor structural protein n=1 Tax=Thermoactinomyces sp. DSM 45892 TaxID=1882753 RepID=UPI00089C4A48|nr:DUF859 family phage minor structural protein [Thermoactinomyces sp. DSM 45892]SDX96068.1 virus protein of unknown function [Thermoactinomyces sp. DSM 45892]